MPATDGTIRIVLFRSERRLLARVVAASTIVALAIGAFLLARRAAGAFSAPLPVSQLLATAVIAATWALVVREFSARRPLPIALALIVLLMLGVACSWPGARVIDWLVWPSAMFAVVLCPPFARSAAKQPLRVASSATEIKRTEGNDEDDSEQVLQQLTRIRTEGGREAIRGLLIAEFAPGERQVTLYIAFCPPFERLPQVEVNVADDSDAAVKLTQLLHNGAQLDVRLPQTADENTTVALELFATDTDSPIAD